MIKPLPERKLQLVVRGPDDTDPGKVHRPLYHFYRVCVPFQRGILVRVALVMQSTNHRFVTEPVPRRVRCV